MKSSGLITAGGIVAFVFMAFASLVGAQTIQTICSFGALAATNGANPEAALTLGADGNFYGTTSLGGSRNFGTVFRVTTNGTVSTLFSFNNTNGAYPQAALVLGTDGNFYGTTSGGGGLLNGGRGYGTIFRITTNGIFSKLFSFNNANGTSPTGLTLGPDGNFYGTTTSSASGTQSGTLFAVSPNGILTTLGFIFLGQSTLAIGPDGNLYGTTYNGGSGQGSVFMMTTNGYLTTPVSFTSQDDQSDYDENHGYNPKAGLTLGTDGNFYGTTFNGGSQLGFNDYFYTDSHYGTIFRMTTNGVLSTLLSFNNTNGANPNTALTLGPDGNFYGITSSSSSYQATVFAMTPYGALATLVSFNNTNGYGPSSLILGPDGNFYGTTSGMLNLSTYNYGTIFRLLLPPVITAQPQNAVNNAGTTAVFTIGTASCQPLSFQWQKNGINLTDGGNISGTASETLTITGVSSNDVGFYAVTVTNANGSTTSSNATLTVNDPSVSSGIIKVLVSFNIANGQNPHASLTQGLDGNFYGTTGYGGSSGYGTVFKVETNGTCSTLVAFNYANGAIPVGALTLGLDGNFYGTTARGGSFGYGTVFRITTNGMLTTLFAFNGSNGADPEAALTLGHDGNFYGTTRYGGLTNSSVRFGMGTLFQLTTNGNLATLVSFNGINGETPSALTLGPDGNFYGTTFGSANNSNGTVFKMTTNGTLTTLAIISGEGPQHALTWGTDGNFYGASYVGGFIGSLFKVTTNYSLTTLVIFNGVNGSVPNDLVLGPDGNFYGTANSGGDNHDAGTVFMVTPYGIFSTLVSFNTTNGQWPEAALALGSDGDFYGTTTYGGITNSTCPNGMGTIFHLLLPPVVIVQPKSQTNVAGAAVSFLVNATSLHSMSFQWQRNGTNLMDGGNISGSATSALSITNISDADVASYNVVMTNLYASVTSSNAMLTVIDPPAITAQPLGHRIVLGNGVAFNVAVSGTAPFNYQWRFNAGNLLNATNVLYAIPAVGTNHAGNYSVVVTNLAGSVTSSNALLVVLVPPSLALQLWAGYPLLNLNGMLSNNFTVQYSPDLTGTNWITLQTFSNLLTSPYLFLDPAGSGQPVRFYRVWMQ